VAVPILALTRRPRGTVPSPAGTRGGQSPRPPAISRVLHAEANRFGCAAGTDCWLDSRYQGKYIGFVEPKEHRERVSYWKELSQYDLDTAAVMLEGRRYLYVGFMCHQAVEKALKALHWHFVRTEPEYTHSLSRLARKAGLLSSLVPEQIRFLDMLEPLNIGARYPSDRDLMSKTMTRDRCESILSTTKGFIAWLDQRYLQ
jgi:HEPN domain-containing protein